MAPTIGVVISGLLACVLLVASGFASGSEIAIFSLSPNDIDELAEEKSDGDVKIMQLRDDSERTLDIGLPAQLSFVPPNIRITSGQPRLPTRLIKLRSL
ncbi:DUF21 domain-containing protein [Xylanibacter rodentium]|uniref:DUF21 domain-containing protein n=1 Tax=Xylanibacter rodentium TaxID=2736289 RepID=UPI0039788DEA